jgi:phosphoenolpyruvate synthase/pyruvate phosphate dikinase
LIQEVEEVFEMSDQELSELKDRAKALEQEIGVETDKEERLAKRAELAAKENRIATLQTEITERRKIQVKFLFLRSEFYFLLEFVYFLWP